MLHSTITASRVVRTSRRQRWRALAAPVEAMTFDFYEAAEDMTPAEAKLRVSATAAGICNAVAFWFELQLDATTSLSTSPYADKARMHQPHDVVHLPDADCLLHHDHHRKVGLLMAVKARASAFHPILIGYCTGSNLAAGCAMGRGDASGTRGLPDRDRCPRYLRPLISHPECCKA